MLIITMKHQMKYISYRRNITKVALGAFRGFEIGVATKEDCWRLWYLRSGAQGLFVTYNCAPQDLGIEDSIVEEILSTLQVADPLPG